MMRRFWGIWRIFEGWSSCCVVAVGHCVYCANEFRVLACACRRSCITY